MGLSPRIKAIFKPFRYSNLQEVLLTQLGYDDKQQMHLTVIDPTEGLSFVGGKQAVGKKLWLSQLVSASKGDAMMVIIAMVLGWQYQPPEWLCFQGLIYLNKACTDGKGNCIRLLHSPLRSSGAFDLFEAEISGGAGN